MEALKKNIKLIGFIGCAIMILGNFLPFVTAKASILGVHASESQSLFTGENVILGIIALVIEIVLILMIRADKKKLTLIPVGIMLVFLLICKSSYSEADLGFASVKFGLGFYAILVGSIMCIVYAFVNGNNETKKVTNNTKFCPKCGAKLTSTAKFCNNCGEEIN